MLDEVEQMVELERIWYEHLVLSGMVLECSEGDWRLRDTELCSLEGS